jgi:23S rRNA maturation-related 3'-5' exoribonuclease YhaM
MNREEIFRIELGYIKSERIRNACIEMLKVLPEYFFEIEASSTGKYHPNYALGNGGLVRHTKAAVRIAYELLGDACIGDKYTQDEKDLMIMALILHDGVKSGVPKEKYTRFDHPIMMGQMIMDNEDNMELEMEEIEFLDDVIKTHMGPWTTDYNGVEVLERPKTKYQNFVHMCDFLASRKFLEVPFDESNNISV